MDSQIPAPVPELPTLLPTADTESVMVPFKCLPRKVHQTKTISHCSWQVKKIPSALLKDQGITMRYDGRFSRTPLHHSIPHTIGHIYDHTGKDIFNYPPKFTWHRHKGDEGNLNKFLRAIEKHRFEKIPECGSSHEKIFWGVWFYSGLCSLLYAFVLFCCFLPFGGCGQELRKAMWYK